MGDTANYIRLSQQELEQILGGDLNKLNSILDEQFPRTIGADPTHLICQLYAQSGWKTVRQRAEKAGFSEPRLKQEVKTRELHVWFNLDKLWNELHILLTGYADLSRSAAQISELNDPFSLALFGAAPIAKSTATYLSSRQVATISRVLQVLRYEELATKHEVVTGTDDDVMMEVFQEFKAFFAASASEQACIILTGSAITDRDFHNQAVESTMPSQKLAEGEERRQIAESLAQEPEQIRLLRQSVEAIDLGYKDLIRVIQRLRKKEKAEQHLHYKKHPGILLQDCEKCPHFAEHALQGLIFLHSGVDNLHLSRLPNNSVFTDYIPDYTMFIRDVISNFDKALVERFPPEFDRFSTEAEAAQEGLQQVICGLRNAEITDLAKLDQSLLELRQNLCVLQTAMIEFFKANCLDSNARRRGLDFLVSLVRTRPLLRARVTWKALLNLYGLTMAEVDNEAERLNGLHGKPAPIWQRDDDAYSEEG